MTGRQSISRVVVAAGKGAAIKSTGTKGQLERSKIIEGRKNQDSGSREGKIGQRA